MANDIDVFVDQLLEESGADVSRGVRVSPMHRRSPVLDAVRSLIQQTAQRAGVRAHVLNMDA